MITAAVIPARYASTRLPAKALARETGKYLIQHVYEQVKRCRRLNLVTVATDDERIVAAVKSFGGDVCLTRADHVSGTDRVAEVADTLHLADDDLVLNVQGDEPEIHSSVLDRLIESFEPSGSGPPKPRIGTVAARFFDRGPKEGPGSPLDPNRVKVVVDRYGKALYFSRSPIPYPRSTGGIIEHPSRWLLHMGVYAFRANTLRSLTSGLPAGTLENIESLEQLRWLEAGHDIGVVLVDHVFVGVDTPADYAAFVRRVNEQERGRIERSYASTKE